MAFAGGCPAGFPQRVRVASLLSQRLSHGLHQQIQGCIIMGLGPALREEMRFANGEIRNATFSRYLVPRLTDVPELDIHVLPRPDLASAGGGETPIIAIAPAIANAVFHATGMRLRDMPLRLKPGQEA